MTIEVKFKKINKEAKIPSYAHPGDAGMDVFALEKNTIKPGERTAVKTGISMEIPSGYVALVWDKSGLSIRDGLKTLGGVIDSGYRGEVLIGMVNLSDKEYAFEAGHKVAQILIQKIENPTIVEVSALKETQRGEGKFGSTGK